MAQDVAMGNIPVVTLGWRLRMSLGPIPAKEMARLLGVHRGTVTRWMEDKSPVRPIYLKQWALITGVDYSWLETGKEPTYSGPFPDSRATRQYEALQNGNPVTSILRLWGDTVRVPLTAAA